MFRIAVCDDEPIFAEELAKCIYQTERQFSEELVVDKYSSGECLVDKLTKGNRYDLIFLDIMMPGYNGIETGSYIRERLQNNVTQIVYVSYEKKYAMELFKVRPMDFLIKPVTIEDVSKIMNTAIQLTGNNKKIFTYSVRGEIYRIPVGDICYIMSRYRKLIIYTVNNQYEFYGKLEDVEKQLKPCDFVVINKSCIVNYSYIKSIKAEKITMYNGEELPVSRNRKDELRNICSSK